MWSILMYGHDLFGKPYSTTKICLAYFRSIPVQIILMYNPKESDVSRVLQFVKPHSVKVPQHEFLKRCYLLEPQVSTSRECRNICRAEHDSVKWFIRNR